MDDLISRQSAIDAFEDTTYTKNEIRRRITELPSAQQDCTECEEYDTERHSCPKYCEVIRQTVEEAQEPTWEQVKEYCKKRYLTICTTYEYKQLVDDSAAYSAQKRTGRWIPVTNGRGGFECDQCHNYAPSYQDGVEWLSDFCPDCGAKMEGEADG